MASTGSTGKETRAHLIGRKLKPFRLASARLMHAGSPALDKLAGAGPMARLLQRLDSLPDFLDFEPFDTLSGELLPGEPADTAVETGQGMRDSLVRSARRGAQAGGGFLQGKARAPAQSAQPSLTAVPAVKSTPVTVTTDQKAARSSSTVSSKKPAGQGEHVSPASEQTGATQVADASAFGALGAALKKIASLVPGASQASSSVPPLEVGNPPRTAATNDLATGAFPSPAHTTATSALVGAATGSLGSGAVTGPAQAVGAAAGSAALAVLVQALRKQEETTREARDKAARGQQTVSRDADPTPGRSFGAGSSPDAPLPSEAVSIAEIIGVVGGDDPPGPNASDEDDRRPRFDAAQELAEQVNRVLKEQAWLRGVDLP